MSDFGSYLPQCSRTRWGSGQGAQISDEEKKRKEKDFESYGQRVDI
jgi:hypothetical protein